MSAGNGLPVSLQAATVQATRKNSGISSIKDVVLSLGLHMFAESCVAKNPLAVSECLGQVVSTFLHFCFNSNG